MSDSKPLGQRFSHVYLEREKPKDDSPTMRRRLAALIRSLDDLRGNLGPEIEREIGVGVQSATGLGYDWVEFFRECDLRVALDTITVAWRLLEKKKRTGLASLNSAATLLNEAARIFSEENVGYQVDARGGVHLLIDAEFEANRQSTIASLAGPRYSNVLNSVERAHERLCEIPPNGKDAIRAVFKAAESLFKLMFPDEPRLTASAAAEKVSPLVQRRYDDNSAATFAGSKLVASFADWIDSANFYRHEPGSEVIAQPPLELAVSLVSMGNTYLRWLGELDALLSEGCSGYDLKGSEK
jgi:hypothetical protein